MINVGELKDKIEIIGIEIGLSDYGAEIEKEVVVATLRAKRKTQSTKDFFANNKNETAVIEKFICRNRGFNAECLLRYKGVRYEIRHIAEFGITGFVEIVAEKVI